MSSKIIGIDLGTTNSVVAVLEGGEPKVIPNKEGGRLTPSVVAFQDNGQRLVGGPAKRQAVTNPERTIFSIKRFMGRRVEEVRDEIARVPYEIVGQPEEPVKIRIGEKMYTPPEISAAILSYLKECAEDYLGHPVTEAVITVPAYFNDAQRQATKDAGAIAGLKVERLLNEPTAAAIAYGLDKKKGGKVAVFDLGGGTFDVSILDIGDGVFEVLSTSGDTHLGGDDFDQVLIDFVAEEFLKENGIDLRQDNMALQRLKEACEKAKIELSSSQETTINLPFITADQTGPKHLMTKITRARFEQLAEDLFGRLVPPCKQALSDAGLEAKDVDEVILVGGSTRIPRVQEVVQEVFGKEPNKSMNPDEVVAMGAAIQGGVLGGELENVVLLDVTPLSLGIETQGGVMTVMIPRNTTIPTTKKEIFSTASDNQSTVEIHVLQGERPMAKDNRTLARFQLTGIPPAPRGVPQIEVEFDIDANGILHVKARDKATGKSQEIRIEQGSGLTEEEIQRMQEEAERFAEEDRKARERAEKRNLADTAAYSARKLLSELGDQVGESEKQAVEEKVSAIEKALEEDRVDDLDRLVQELQQVVQPLAQRAQQTQGAQAQGGPEAGKQAESGEGSGGAEDDVVDADFEVKN